MTKTISAIICFLVFSQSAFSATYYIATSGSDSNTSTQAQSKSTPWAHRPGCASATSNAAAYVPQPGDRFIYKGGDVWPAATFPCMMDNGGSGGASGNPIYDGVDKTWFDAITGTVNTVGTSVTWVSGVRSFGDFFALCVNGSMIAGAQITINGTIYSVASACTNPQSITLSSSAGTQTGVSFSINYWTFPMMNAGGTYPGTKTSFSNAIFEYGYAPHWILDSIEITGFYVSNTSGVLAGMVTCNNGSTCVDGEAKGFFIHGWNHAAAPATTEGIAGFYWNGQNNNTSSIHDGVIDGFDVVEADCSHALALPCHSGEGSQNGPGIVYNSYLAHLSNALNVNVTGDWIVHDNHIVDIQCDYDGVTHANIMQTTASEANTYIYNNLVNGIGGCNSPFTPSAQSNSVNYFFNNVYANQNASNNQVWNFVGAGVVNNMQWYGFNNIYEAGPDSGTPSANPFEIDISSTNSVFTLINNQGITTAGTIYRTIGSGSSYTLTNTNNLLNSLSYWNANGYTLAQTQPFSPTSTSSPTVGAGTSIAAICSGIANSAAKTACSSSTSNGASEVPGYGGYVTFGTLSTPVLRSSTPDAGAYQYASAPSGLAGTLLPGTTLLPGATVLQ